MIPPLTLSMYRAATVRKTMLRTIRDCEAVRILCSVLPFLGRWAEADRAREVENAKSAQRGAVRWFLQQDPEMPEVLEIESISDEALDAAIAYFGGLSGLVRAGVFRLQALQDRRFAAGRSEFMRIWEASGEVLPALQAYLAQGAPASRVPQLLDEAKGSFRPLTNQFPPTAGGK